MGEIQEPKFFCKFCNKACFTGKSLGGHMRCHLDLIAAAKKQKLKSENCEEDLGVSVSEVPKNQERGIDQASYGLREKPLKSWKVSDPKKHCGGLNNDLCKECGKRFASVKALAGHLKCHSRKGIEDHHICKKCGKGFDSIRALYGHMKIHSKRSRAENEEEEEDDKEEEESVQMITDLCPVRKKRSTIRYKLTSPNPPLNSVASELEEIQDAAMCLMMLSRGVKSWNEFVFCNEEMPNSDDDNDDDDDDKQSISWKTISEIYNEKKAAFEVCVNGYINNIEQFKNAEKGFLEIGETSTTSEIFCAEEIKESKHSCPVCFKVFQSGQALGGHKRAHYNANIEPKVKKENLYEILDLNLPVNAATAMALLISN